MDGAWYTRDADTYHTNFSIIFSWMHCSHTPKQSRQQIAPHLQFPNINPWMHFAHASGLTPHCLLISRHTSRVTVTVLVKKNSPAASYTLQMYPWFPNLWLSWCAGENAQALLFVLVVAGCASYLSHLYPVQLSYPLSLLNSYVPTHVWKRTTTHGEDQYVCDPRMPWNNDKLSQTFMWWNMCWQRCTSS